MTKKIIAIMLILGITSLSACTSDNRAKDLLQQSLQKQEEIQNHRFKGSAQIRIERAGSEPSSPAGQIVSWMQNSTLEWEGVSAVEPARLEMTLKMTPAALQKTFEIPIILKDSKMYFSMPLLNAKDEYYVIELEKWSPTSGGASPAKGRLDSLYHFTSKMWGQWLSAIDSKWFRLEDASENNGGQTITIHVDKTNAAQIAQEMMSQLPHIWEWLKNNGLLADFPDTAPQEKAERIVSAIESLEHIQGKIAFHLDNNGYILKQEVNFAFEQPDQGVKTQVSVVHQQDEINQNPSFEKNTPEKTRPFEEIVQFIKGNE